MAEILSARIVLRLNANWRRIGFATVAQAFTSLTGGDQSNPPALALDIDYELDENGKPNFEKIISAVPRNWDEWQYVPIRDGDMTISTINQKIRVPTIIICPKFAKMPVKKLRPTKQGIRERDGNKCQYTGKNLTNKTASLDHVLPKSKGGQDTWENLVLCHRDVNSKKGNRLNDEAGLTLLNRPIAPKPIPVCELIRDIKHPDHAFF
jgi:5-methylcytosine-specific restriction endonuclease McrA